MKPIRIYQYEKCDSCRKAIHFLQARGIQFESIDIYRQAPSRAELQHLLKTVGGATKRLFNTSGKVYREKGLGKLVGGMPTAEALALLEKDGRLVKRPFLVSENGGLIGFKEIEWNKFFEGKTKTA